MSRARAGEARDLAPATISEALAVSQRYAKEDEALMTASGEQIGQVVQGLRSAALELSSSSRALTEEGQEVAREIGEVLVALQFQDRVSQVLGHVEGDMDRLRKRLAVARSDIEVGITPEPLDSSAWLTDMSRSFTTPEQHALHKGTGSGSAQMDSGITFF